MDFRAREMIFFNFVFFPSYFEQNNQVKNGQLITTKKLVHLYGV